MNIIQIFFENLADNSCNNLPITVTIVLSISVTSYFTTCKIISYLNCKREHENEIEKQIFRNNNFDELDKRLKAVEKELQDIKAKGMNKKKGFLSCLWEKLCK
jgi:hypothetical protein